MQLLARIRLKLDAAFTRTFTELLWKRRCGAERSLRYAPPCWWLNAGSRYSCSSDSNGNRRVHRLGRRLRPLRQTALGTTSAKGAGIRLACEELSATFRALEMLKKLKAR